ncbi:hypothetical protein CDD80_5379 [Ophiocordyceps camponoti-rufipedis]|uniref:Glycosyl transferase CAP10 domain-containing protein n=1 Tax=Ophiocordyceps camponoti-rufipedis TaxID=2004952 RepID=A0A2C5ZHK4_9HYPO|nr:hypothetical protein CDD80_5379 [Ophiocordyceps camponoti-rufipedis]
MGPVSNPLRSREQRLPLYQKIDPSTKERYSDDGFESPISDTESDHTLAAVSPCRSRDVSHSASKSHFLLSRRRPILSPLSPRKAALYPYRLPTRISRYVFLGVLGILVLMILSLIRASQVENWKVVNGKVSLAPPPPPVWEKFPFLERYYGGLRQLRPYNESEPQYPRPAEPRSPSALSRGRTAAREAVPPSKSWQHFPGRSTESDIRECFLDVDGKVRPPPLRYYEGRPLGFPENVAGSYDLLKLPQDICFERFGRLGPYGLGYSIGEGGLGTSEHGDREGSETVWEETRQVDYRRVDWASVQRQCFDANADRFSELPESTPTPHGFYVEADRPTELQNRDVPVKRNSSHVKFTRDHETDMLPVKKQARTAVVVRCWDEYLFREDDIANMRAMITELSLASGGRYDVHLLVQVKNDAHNPIWADHEAYEKRIRDSVPKEFQGLVTLWTETQMLSLYQGIYDLWSRGPGLPVHGVYRGLAMAMQYFAYQHPEYDFFWQWEMDIRYTGHYHDLLSKIEEWAKEQPRKGLWERNSRFYIPSVHGSWDDFTQMTRVQTAMSADKDQVLGVGKEAKKTTERAKPVWGPLRPSDANDWFETEGDAMPETEYDDDRYQWGVGEEADYISLNPLFDPEGTTWLLKDDITGFNGSQPLPPRRASIITTARMSRRLLMAMHRTTAYKKQFAFPEMWPATVALHHGFKSVFAPHPMYVDRKWPVKYMAQVYNGGRDGTSGGARTSIFGEREHNMQGISWYYNSGFAPNLYRRWLGLTVNNDGGPDFETTADDTKKGAGVGNMPGGEGRMCLPPMLLHPVKDVEQPVRAPGDDVARTGDELPIRDPTA